MAYPGDAVVVPFVISSPLLRVPSSVQYTVTSSTGEDLSTYLPKDSLRGFLTWDQQPGPWLNLTLPIDWSSVPPQAEYRLSVRLEDPWMARVVGAADNATAVHIFGVLPDQCPPGTFSR